MYMRKYLKMEPNDKDSHPSQTSDLKSMLMSFRITELQEVLCTCGRPRSGRKTELLSRAVNLLKQSEGTSMRERVKNRIVELYKWRFPTRPLPPSLSSSSLYSSVDNSDKQSRGKEPNTRQAVTSPTRASSGSRQETSSTTATTERERGRHTSNTSHSENSENSQNSRVGSSYAPSSNRRISGSSSHRTAIFEPVNRGKDVSPMSRTNTTDQTYRIGGCHVGMPVHPDVRFINLPFADIQDVLIKPTSLGQKKLSGCQDIGLVFHLSPSQVQTITQSKSYTLQSRVEFSVQVLLRFCLAETSCVQEDSYPLKCSIKVNGKLCPVPGQPPSSSQNLEPKKPHRPVNITSFCRLSPVIANHVQIAWLPSDLGQRYAVTIQLVKSVTASTLVQKLKAKPQRNADHSRALIKEKLAHDPDNEVATTSLKVCLCCPIGKTRMTLPCRATTCNHVQCFDGSLYIQMNERKPNWTCPVCDQRAHYDQLIVDGLFMEILRAAPDTNDIRFSQDGSWKPMRDADQESRAAITTIVGTPSAPKDNEVKLKDKEAELIDLTADSSDDEEPSPKTSKTTSYVPPSSLGQQRGPRVRMVPTTSIPRPTFPSLFDPEIQGSDFYAMLPDEDRMAAEYYLAQSGILNQFSSSRHSPSDVISLD